MFKLTESRAALFVILPAALLLAPAALPAQDLADYDYENLGFRGIGGGFGYMDTKNLDAVPFLMLRADLGYLGPDVRLMPRFAYWASDIQDDEINRIEEQIEALPGNVGDVEFGEVDRKIFVIGADIQYAVAAETFSPYVGIGLDAYILNGGGEVIDGTFIEDELDEVTAGISAVAGAEGFVSEDVLIYGELRGGLVSDVTNLSVGAGIAYRFP